ncbi:MAG TPA: hypothetical protein P5567_02385 [Kiritimatiellia bacterium]|nr:hypothetical protein [Kiritimatiellia bacterium]HRZ11280.1 hypothetical protein [Kiritimatiellia bacterium]HSA19747.1 hypothetical protein [Kiritimatiellia bacterium]
MQRVLDFLNRNRLRATYGDVARFLGIPMPALAELLGPPRPAASWVVNSETGKPSGYAEADCHPDLRSHDVIVDEADLRLKIQREKTNRPSIRAARRPHRRIA